jgi:hypothetical protein
LGEVRKKQIDEFFGRHDAGSLKGLGKMLGVTGDEVAGGGVSAFQKTVV